MKTSFMRTSAQENHCLCGQMLKRTIVYIVCEDHCLRESLFIVFMKTIVRGPLFIRTIGSEDH